MDCASLAIMERMASGTVFTFDDDFDRYRYGTAKEGFFTRARGLTVLTFDWVLSKVLESAGSRSSQA